MQSAMKSFPMTGNRAQDLILEAKRIADSIAATNPHVSGILLTGGAARGFADHLSDLDIEVFYRRNLTKVVLPPGAASGNYSPQGNYIETELRCHDEWADRRNDERIWTMANRWDKRHAQILHDPRGEIAALLRRKLVFRPGELKELRRDAHGDMRWLCRGVAQDWIERGDLHAAHHVINTAIDLLLDFLFLKSSAFIPHPKWKLFFARQLEIIPRDFDARLAEALIVREYSAEDIRRRQAALFALVIEAQHLPNLPELRANQ
jgi:hypothetical protein